tara:strand:+ start:1179 stop:1478 length:300 start_codon:yes stop_codon:yes gene_type:complete
MNGILRVIDQFGEPRVGVSVQARLVGDEFTQTSYVKNASQSFLTDENGEVAIPILSSSSFEDGCAIYEITVGDKKRSRSFRINAPDTDEDFCIYSERIK